MSSILKWFQGRREKAIRDEFTRYVDTIVEVVERFEEVLRSWVSGKYRAEYVEILHAKERDADTQRRNILTMLAESTMESAAKVYLARVARQADLIADWCLEASRIIDIVSETTLPEEVSSVLLEMGRVIGEEVRKAREAVKCMFECPHRALECCDEVERLEEKVDDLYHDLRKKYLSSGSDLPAPVTTLLFEVFDAVENIADRCEDTCDAIREFMVSRV